MDDSQKEKFIRHLVNITQGQNSYYKYKNETLLYLIGAVFNGISAMIGYRTLINNDFDYLTIPLAVAVSIGTIISYKSATECYAYFGIMQHISRKLEEDKMSLSGEWCNANIKKYYP